jgi:hypothetical protein
MKQIEGDAAKIELPAGNCNSCPLKDGERYPFTIPPSSDFYIESVRLTKEQVDILALIRATELVIEIFECPWIKARRITGWQTVSELVVYPYAQELRLDKGNLVDELGREFRKKVIYFLGDKDSTVQSYKAKSTVMPHPKNQTATMLVESWEPLEAVPQGVKQVKISLGELKDRVQELSKITGIHNRFNAHLTVLMNHASPLAFKFQGELVEGWGKIAWIGETTTGKGATANGIRRVLGLGGLAIGESASRAGLLYGVETVGNTHVLQWGLIPRYDGQHLVVDGCNAIPPSEWRACREAMRQGIVRVDKIVGGRHPARTRLLFIGNPKLPFSAYYAKIESINELFESPDIARLDLALIFDISDVSPEVINQRSEPISAKEAESLIGPLRSNIAFAWRCPPEDLSFTEGAVHTILTHAIDLIKEYGSDQIPLVSNDMKKKLARLSLELALLCGENEVTKDYVEAVVTLLREIYDHAELGKHAQKRRAQTANEQDKVLEAAEWLGEEVKNDEIIRRLIGEIFAPGQVFPKKVIAEKLGRDPRTVDERLSKLRARSLVIQTKLGVEPAPLLRQVLREMEGKSSSGNNQIGEDRVDL